MVLAGGAIAWCGLIVLSPLLLAQSSPGSGEAGFLARLFFSPVCHQEVARSFSLWSKPLAVCARCTGIYAGFTLAVLAYPAVRSRRLPPLQLPGLAAFLALTALDYAGTVLGIWENTMLSRSLTGLVAGLGLGLFLTPAWITLWRGSPYRKHHVSFPAS